MQLAHTLELSLPGIVSSQAEQDDAQLVQASQQGNQDAFACLVQRHQRLVFTMVLRMLQEFRHLWKRASRAGARITLHRRSS